MTPSSRGCTPLFLNAEPQNTGKNLAIDRAAADQPAQRVVVRHLAVEVSLGRRIVDIDGGFDHLLAVLSARSLRSSGILDTSHWAPSSSLRHISAFISMRSTMPLKSLSAPIGSCMTTS